MPSIPLMRGSGSGCRVAPRISVSQERGSLDRLATGAAHTFLKTPISGENVSQRRRTTV